MASNYSNTAYAMEAAIDEIVFILGPILAAWLATSVHPVSQLFVPTMACGIGGTVFFSLRSTQPPVIVEQVTVAAADNGHPTPSDDADQLTLRQLKTQRSQAQECVALMPVCCLCWPCSSYST